MLETHILEFSWYFEDFLAVEIDESPYVENMEQEEV